MKLNIRAHTRLAARISNDFDEMLIIYLKLLEVAAESRLRLRLAHFHNFPDCLFFLLHRRHSFCSKPFYTKIKFVLIFLLLTSRSLLDTKNVFDDDSASALFLSFIREAT